MTSAVRIGRQDRAVALAAVALWVVFFMIGSVVETRTIRERYDPPPAHSTTTETPEAGGDAQPPRSESRSGSLAAEDFLVLLVAYTPVNVAILSVLAGLIGVAGARVRLGLDERGEEADAELLDTRSPYVSGVIRGFVVYLALLSGMLLIVGDPFESLDSQTYVRIAGVASLLSFVVNHNPVVFTRLLERLIEKMHEKDKPS